MDAQQTIEVLRKEFVTFADQEGYEVCDEYDPAGTGAGVGLDGQPVCAMCGFSRIVHAVDVFAREFVNARGEIQDEATGNTRPMTADERKAWDAR
jgi:hypothetical protein